MENIIEGTELIAEFIGYIKTSQDIDFTFYEHPDGKGIVIQSGYDYNRFITHALMEVRGFRFHSSWDWIMPVVEKIESIFNNGVCVTIDNKSCFIVTTNGNFSRYVTADSKIESVFLACVEFVKWYNKQINCKN